MDSRSGRYLEYFSTGDFILESMLLIILVIIVFFLIKKSFFYILSGKGEKEALMSAGAQCQDKIYIKNQRIALEKLKTLETIKLTPANGTPDAYYSNNEVFVTFCLNDIFPDSYKEYPIYAGQEDVLLFKETRDRYLAIKNGKRLPDTFGAYLPDILNSGKVMVYSKVESKFVNEIKKEKWGFSAGSLAGRGGYKYYFTDGSLFFSILTWAS